MNDLKWGWVNADGKAQAEVFNSAEDAIAEMQRRLGNDYTIERIIEVGFSLALVRVQIEVIALMRPA